VIHREVGVTGVDRAARRVYNLNVGAFDTVLSSTREAQVKCFGRASKEYEIGSVVTLYEEPPNERDEHRTCVELPERNYQVAMDDGSFLTVIHGRFRFWDEIRITDLPVFDRYGRAWDGSLDTAGFVDPTPLVEFEPQD
jgi:hypothetical protein